MSWTKREIIESAYAELGYASYAFDLQPEQYQIALSRLDAMVATWKSRGVIINYQAPADTGVSTLDEETLVDNGQEALYLNLALRLAPLVGKQASMETKRSAAIAFRELLSTTANMPQYCYPSTLPAGQGNKPYRMGLSGEYVVGSCNNCNSGCSSCTNATFSIAGQDYASYNSNTGILTFNQVDLSDNVTNYLPLNSIIPSTLTSTFIGRFSGGGGAWEEVTPLQARTMLNVEDNAEENPAPVTSEERTAGTETGLRTFSPADVAYMALTHGPGGVPTAASISFVPFGSYTSSTIQAIVEEVVTDLASPETLFDVAEDVLIGRTSSGSGESEELTPAAVRTLLNVETGATGDQTDAEIETAYNNQVAQVSAGEITSGTETGVRRLSPADVVSFVTTHSPGGGTVDVLSNVATSVIVGRTTAGSGDSEELTPAAVRSLINVEDGATADQTGAQIKSAYEGEADTNAFTDAHQTKLAGIATGAEVNVDTDLSYTAGTRELASSTGVNVTLPEVVADGDSGLMTGADKEKLDLLNLMEVHNASGADILADTVVYITGTHASGLPTIDLADNTAAATMPAVGYVETTITDGTAGNIRVLGLVAGIDTSSFTAQDVLYVGTAGALVATKPTGTALIQNVGIVARSHASAGSIELLGSGRTNDLPNLAENYTWVGNASGVPTATPTSSLGGSGQSVDATARTANFTAANNYIYMIDNSSAEITVTLPAALTTNAGQKITLIMQDDLSANNVIVESADTDHTINGVAADGSDVAKAKWKALQNGWHVVDFYVIADDVWACSEPEDVYNVLRYYAECAETSTSASGSGLTLTTIPTDVLTENGDWWVAIKMETSWEDIGGSSAINILASNNGGLALYPDLTYLTTAGTSGYLMTNSGNETHTAGDWIVIQYDSTANNLDLWTGTEKEMDGVSESTTGFPATAPTSMEWFGEPGTSNYHYGINNNSGIDPVYVSVLAMGTGLWADADATQFNSSEFNPDDWTTAGTASVDYVWNVTDTGFNNLVGTNSLTVDTPADWEFGADHTA